MKQEGEKLPQMLQSILFITLHLCPSPDQLVHCFFVNLKTTDRRDHSTKPMECHNSELVHPEGPHLEGRRPETSRAVLR